MKEKRYNLKNIRQEFKEKWIFYTDPALVKFMVELIPENFEFSEVYDPTCWDGWLLEYFKDSKKIFWQEINDHQLEVAKNKLGENFSWFIWDTLENPNPEWKNKKFSLILANPPFSIKWNSEGKENDERFKDLPALPPPSKADFAFIAHILHYLDNNWLAIVIEFPGICYRGSREWKIRQYLIEKNYIEKVIAIPPNNFTDTKIPTVCLVLRKNKTNTDILFMDAETKKERLMSLEEVAENWYNLTTKTYLPDERKEPEMTDDDVFRLEVEKWTNKLISLELDIGLNKTIRELYVWIDEVWLEKYKQIIVNFFNQVEEIKKKFLNISYPQNFKRTN